MDIKKEMKGPDDYETDVAVAHSATLGVADEEFREYTELSGLFQGPRLRKVTRKIDFRVLPQLLLIYLISYVDRSNVGNARLFGAAADMKLSGQQWNAGLSVFFVTYGAFAVPSNIMLKRVGQRIWLSTLITGVGIVCVCSGLQVNYAGWISFRLLLGVVEAGVYSGCTYALTSWYSPKELHSRMTLFYSGGALSGAFSGLLAYAIGQLDHTWGYRGWRFIYVSEGIFTTLIGIISFFWLIPEPDQAGKWLDDEERRFLILRHRFAAGGESGIAEKEEFSWKHAGAAFRSIHVYPLAMIGFAVSGVIYAISFTLPTIINNLGYSAADAQALTVPPYVFACLCTVVAGFAADKYEKRMLSIFVPSIFAAIGCAIVMSTVRFSGMEGATLFGCFIMAGGLYPAVPSVTAWVSLNVAGSMKRAVAIAITFTLTVLSGILGSNIFLAAEAPEYTTGFSVSLVMITVFSIFTSLAYWMVLKRINSKRAAIPTEEIKAKYTEAELADMGDLSPAFRYAT